MEIRIDTGVTANSTMIALVQNIVVPLPGGYWILTPAGQRALTVRKNKNRQATFVACRSEFPTLI